MTRRRQFRQFRLTTASRPENLADIARFIAGATAHLGLDERETFDVQVAVDEACTNIMRYAYGPDGEGPIELCCELQDDACVITIHDWGRAFDPSAVPEPDVTSPLHKRKLGGLGLYFMRKLMDEVRFEFDAEKGNYLTMVRRRRSKSE
jgi:serine/threonine-protein kinase RsbW